MREDDIVPRDGVRDDSARARVTLATSSTHDGGPGKNDRGEEGPIRCLAQGAVRRGARDASERRARDDAR